MNGIEKEMIDRRPVVTCAGELEVFSAIEDNLLQSLPRDSAEWKRSLGRPIRSVHIGATFVPFSSVGLPKGNQWDLIRQPLFHIYWTECNDVDVYKAKLKEDIETWLKELTSKDIQDWLIVVVENYDGKRTNKLLPRTTVLDKIRTDFAPKQGDRCISVINPGKSEHAESWKCLINRIRHLLLVAYAKAVSRLEDHVRQQRERRKEPGWKFMNYFHLQEELAQVLEMLGLYDESLVQFDELDALFSQFVVNGVTCESVAWLQDFQTPLERWHALKLGQSHLYDNCSILELRAYLFAKQAHMLLLTDKVWQMASRCLPFLHTCTRELSVLEITSPPGALECWLFLASMEVLQTCDKFNHADEVEAYSQHTAPLWAYASQKLKKLGELCGLLPGSIPTSEQLHTVVGLSAGMGDNPGTPIAPSPTDKLKEALCSQDAFNKTYLELAELAMGTYKHTGRVRSARLVGREVAAFYLLLGETQKAAAFLSDASRLFRQDGWLEVAAHTDKELADCYKQAGDWRKFIRCAAHVSSALDLDTLIRWTYFDEMRKQLEKLEKSLVVPFSDIIKIQRIRIRDTKVTQDANIDVECTIESNFPKEILCDRIRVSIEQQPNKKLDKYSDSTIVNMEDNVRKQRSLRKLKMRRHLDYKQDKQLSSVSVVCCTNELKRKDSTPPINTDFHWSLDVAKSPLLLTPGSNTIRLTTRADKKGKYQLGQMGIFIGKLELISQPLIPRIPIEIEEELPSVRLYKNTAPLISGIEQIMNLIVTIGSYPIDPNTKIKLTSSRGLLIQLIGNNDTLGNSLEFDVGKREISTSTRWKLRVLADMLQTKEHQVTIICPWNTKPIVVSLSFTPPLTISWKLHTVNHRKFVLVNLSGQCNNDLIVGQASLDIGNNGQVLDRNGTYPEILKNSLTYTYIWEFIPHPKTSTINAEFKISYKLHDMNMDSKLYQYSFDITDYQTLYILDASLERSKTNEFPRVGFLCHLNLTITYIGDENTSVRSIMYEVLAEQSVWAVCGRTAGVVNFEVLNKDPKTIMVEIMPLTSGFLPLPLVRISKYIMPEGTSGKSEQHPKLEPFSVGQVYNTTKGKQVHVIVTPNDGNL